MGEIPSQSSRQLDPTEGRLAYVTVVAGIASPQQPSGSHTSTAKGTVPTVHAVSSEAAARRMSLGDKSGTLCGRPDGTTTYAQVVSKRVAPAVDRQNNSPIYVTWDTDTRGFLTWLRASCQSGFQPRLKGIS